MHSALKHQGKRLYELARRGESIERPPRQIVIHRIHRIVLAAERLEFEVRCSKGTYVRTLAADIAQRLGTLGYLAGLRRLSVDPFDGYPMHTLAQIEARLGTNTPAVLDSLLLGADAAFMDLGRIQLGPEGENALLLGQTATALTPAPGESLRAYGANERFLGLVEGQPDGRVSPARLFVGVAGPQA